MSRSALQRASRSRSALSVALTVLDAITLVAAGLTLYVREEILDTSAFAGRAVDAVRHPAVKRVVARAIAVHSSSPACPISSPRVRRSNRR